MVKKVYLIFWGIIFFINVVLAQTSSKKKIKPVWGKIIAPDAVVYEDPHFDSPIIGNLSEGTKVITWPKIINYAFFRVKLPEGTIGYVTDLDIDFPNKPKPPKGPFLDPILRQEKFSDPFEAAEQFDSAIKEDKEKFENEKLFGFRYFLVPYKEKTMGQERRSDVTALGLSLRGVNWVDWAGAIDMGLVFTLQIPHYYQEVLGFEPKGILNWGYFLISTSSSLSSRTQFNYGFGPFYKFQQYIIKADVSGTSLFKSFEATDVKLGGSALFGISHRWRFIAIRFDWQYFWEVTQYSVLSLGLEFPVK